MISSLDSFLSKSKIGGTTNYDITQSGGGKSSNVKKQNRKMGFPTMYMRSSKKSIKRQSDKYLKDIMSNDELDDIMFDKLFDKVMIHVNTLSENKSNVDKDNNIKKASKKKRSKRKVKGTRKKKSIV